MFRENCTVALERGDNFPQLGGIRLGGKLVQTHQKACYGSAVGEAVQRRSV